MEFIAIKTANGLKPAYDSDFDQYQKLKVGKPYKVKVIEKRNYEFHKKYFALINCAWEYQNEKTTAFFTTSENFRKTIEIQAGHFDLCYSICKSDWMQIPKSVSFDSIQQSDFEDLYNRVKDVIYAIFLKGVSQHEFENNLINF